MKKTKVPRSYAAISRRSFTTLLLTIGLVITLTVSVTLSVDQLFRAQNQAAQLSSNLQISQANTFQDWLTINRSSGLNAHNTFVVVKNSDGSTTSFLPSNRVPNLTNSWQVPFTHLIYIPKAGLYFSESDELSNQV